MSMLFTLDDNAKSMERESLDVGVAFVLEALDHARGDLADKGTWDHLVEEAQLHGKAMAQLVAAQQKVAKLTPLAEEVGSLRSQVAEAHRHANEAERVFEALSVRSWKDDKEATKEWELKLGAEEKLVALEKKASLDATVVAQLCKEQDELLQNMERLHSEHGIAHEDHDKALQERDNMQQKINSLQAELGTAMTQRLEAEGISIGLAMDLTEERRNL
ncbi:uncharacterized protein [Miscanthus floridulus]|uniref:uncharacterized protein n=1 Tax=Miscanthus floridulus TaxID=154761 RepID=UPI0034593686